MFEGTVNTTPSTKVTPENVDTIQTGELDGIIDAAVNEITDITTDAANKFFKDAFDAIDEWLEAITTESKAKDMLKDVRTARLNAAADMLGGSKAFLLRLVANFYRFLICFFN